MDTQKQRYWKYRSSKELSDWYLIVAHSCGLYKLTNHHLKHKSGHKRGMTAEGSWAWLTESKLLPLFSILLLLLIDASEGANTNNKWLMCLCISFSMPMKMLKRWYWATNVTWKISGRFLVSEENRSVLFMNLTINSSVFSARLLAVQSVVALYVIMQICLWNKRWH